MNKHIQAALLGATILAVPAAAFAQTTVTTTTRTERVYGPVELTPEQRTTVYRSVRRAPRAQRAPVVVEYRVGTRLPREVELETFDDEVYVQAPALKRYRYVYVNNELLLVDPDTSEVVEVIRD
jgi:hypothetical protein